MLGKQKCKILKEIRQRVAEENDIEYITSECKHTGDCKGTCPKCEEEVKQLELELENRKKAGKTVAIVGVALGVAIGAVGCNAITNMINPDSGYDDLQGEAVPLEGDIAAPEETVDNTCESTTEPNNLENENQDEEPKQ